MTTLPMTRYRRRGEHVDVLDGALVLLEQGAVAELPPGVTFGESGGLLFQGDLITNTSMLVYDDQGTPLRLFTAEEFHATFEAGDERDDLTGQLAQATTMIKKLQTQLLAQNTTIDDLRAEIHRLYLDLERKDTTIGDLQKVAPRDSATTVLRDILRIDPAQVRDDGGRIIHLNRKTIDRALAVVS